MIFCNLHILESTAKPEDQDIILGILPNIASLISKEFVTVLQGGSRVDLYYCVCILQKRTIVN